MDRLAQGYARVDPGAEVLHAVVTMWESAWGEALLIIICFLTGVLIYLIAATILNYPVFARRPNHLAPIGAPRATMLEYAASVVQRFLYPDNLEPSHVRILQDTDSTVVAAPENVEGWEALHARDPLSYTALVAAEVRGDFPNVVRNRANFEAVSIAVVRAMRARGHRVAHIMRDAPIATELVFIPSFWEIRARLLASSYVAADRLEAAPRINL